MYSISTGLWLGVHGSFRASVSRTCLRRRPQRLSLQALSGITVPTSTLVAVSAGMTFSLRAPYPRVNPCNSRSVPGSCAQRRIEDVLLDRGLRFPADDWVLPLVIYWEDAALAGKVRPRPAPAWRDGRRPARSRSEFADAALKCALSRQPWPNRAEMSKSAAKAVPQP